MKNLIKLFLFLTLTVSSSNAGVGAVVPFCVGLVRAALPYGQGVNKFVAQVAIQATKAKFSETVTTVGTALANNKIIITAIFWLLWQAGILQKIITPLGRVLKVPMQLAFYVIIKVIFPVVCFALAFLSGISSVCLPMVGQYCTYQALHGLALPLAGSVGSAVLKMCASKLFGCA